MDWDIFVLRNKISPTLVTNASPTGPTGPLSLVPMGTSGVSVINQLVNGYVLSMAVKIIGSYDGRDAVFTFANTAGATPASLSFTMAQLADLGTETWAGTAALYGWLDDSTKSYSAAFTPDQPSYFNTLKFSVNLPTPNLDPEVPAVAILYEVFYYANIDNLAYQQTAKGIGLAAEGYTGLTSSAPDYSKTPGYSGQTSNPPNYR